jgi:hypothetical protein
VGIVTATDIDLPAQALTFSITGGLDAPLFSITSGGVLSFKTAPDFESPADANADNVYLVQITVDDGAGGTAVQNIAVTVTDVSEGGNSPPTITSLISSNPTFGTRAAPRSPVVVSGLLFDSNVADVHLVTIDWGDGSVPETFDASEHDPQPAASFLRSHIYPHGGIFTIVIVVNDGHGGAASATTTAVVIGVGVVDGTLYVIGTEDRDVVHVKPGRQGGKQHPGIPEVHVQAKLGRGPDGMVFKKSAFALSKVYNIVILLGGGNDHATIHNKVTLPAVIDGGNGNDHLRAGGGRTTLR